MANSYTKTQNDRLGDRLREGQASESDLTALDLYRRSFGAVYDNTVHVLRDGLGLEPTGRPAKSTASIADKLRRENIRLSQVQDIAGCRIVVSDLPEQDRVVTAIKRKFPRAIMVDRRASPSHGYRAVHLIVTEGGKYVEVQIRTALQHHWAELSEKISDLIDPAVKYGGGPAGISQALSSRSQLVSQAEALELQIAGLDGKSPMLKDLRREVAKVMKELIAQLTLVISEIDTLKRRTE
jgi:ppGpp synthetase/RelA/SpoT-type nucleotidyltranferase